MLWTEAQKDLLPLQRGTLGHGPSAMGHASAACRSRLAVYALPYALIGVESKPRGSRPATRPQHGLNCPCHEVQDTPGLWSSTSTLRSAKKKESQADPRKFLEQQMDDLRGATSEIVADKRAEKEAEGRRLRSRTRDARYRSIGAPTASLDACHFSFRYLALAKTEMSPYSLIGAPRLVSTPVNGQI